MVRDMNAAQSTIVLTLKYVMMAFVNWLRDRQRTRDLDRTVVHHREDPEVDHILEVPDREMTEDRGAAAAVTTETTTAGVIVSLRRKCKC